MAAKLGNFKVSVEIEKLKIHIEGAREIAPEIANSVAHHVAGVLQPAGYLEESNGNSPDTVLTPPPAVPPRRTRRRTGPKSEPTQSGAVDWTHDAGRWGTPLQAWKQWQKALWLLYVVDEAGHEDGLTADQIWETFETKFREAGALTRQNIRRDLSRRGDYFGSVDGRWHLKQLGKTEAAKLVAEAKGQQPLTA